VSRWADDRAARRITLPIHGAPAAAAPAPPPPPVAPSPVPPLPPLQLFSFLIDPDATRAFASGQWLDALGLAAVGRLFDWFFNAAMSSNPAGAAALHQIAAQVRFEEIRQALFAGGELLMHLLFPSSPIPARETLERLYDDASAMVAQHRCLDHPRPGR
jgi:hypothetical protein